MYASWISFGAGTVLVGVVELKWRCTWASRCPAGDAIFEHDNARRTDMVDRSIACQQQRDHEEEKEEVEDVSEQ
jgi:hypothetical protein